MALCNKREPSDGRRCPSIRDLLPRQGGTGLCTEPRQHSRKIAEAASDASRSRPLCIAGDTFGSNANISVFLRLGNTEILPLPNCRVRALLRTQVLSIFTRARTPQFSRCRVGR